MSIANWALSYGIIGIKTSAPPAASMIERTPSRWTLNIPVADCAA
jgi:hypothetical protein